MCDVVVGWLVRARRRIGVGHQGGRAAGAGLCQNWLRLECCLYFQPILVRRESLLHGWPVEWCWMRLLRAGLTTRRVTASDARPAPRSRVATASCTIANSLSIDDAGPSRRFRYLARQFGRASPFRLSVFAQHFWICSHGAVPCCRSHSHQPMMSLRPLLRKRMRDYTLEEKTRITAGAVAALVIVLWLAVVALGILSSG